MIRAIKAEFRKFFTTRLWWGMAIAVFVAGAGLAALFALWDPTPEMTGGVTVPTLADPSRVRSVYTGGLSVSYLLTLAIGVMTIGGEYRHKTITSTFLATPRRAQVMIAKVISLVGIGGFYGLVSLVGGVGVGGTIIAIRGYSPFPDSSIPRTLALSLLVLALWALIGLGAGILIPNQVAALLISVGVAWIEINKPHYGIHGTSEPHTIGRAESHGCVRLTNWDAARLAQMVKPGTPAIFQN